MKTMEERIASMANQLKVLKERQNKADAQRKRDDAKRIKQEAARRTILVGNVILKHVQSGDIPETQFRKWMDAALTDSTDRALFNL